MAIVADSGAIYALYDSDDRHHAGVRRTVIKERRPIIIPTALLAEVDYLLREYLGTEAELDFLDSILSSTFILETLQTSDLARCRDLIDRYRDLDLGVADSAVIATAERLGIDRILTVDERHFRAVRSIQGRSFVLLPADGVR
jgi:predicted nucleic acid-binding protein